MKAKLIIAVYLVFSISSNAQIFSGAKMTKQEKKDLKNELQDQRAAEVSAMLQDTLFLLRADRFSASGDIYGSTYKARYPLYNKQSGRGIVNPNLYFVEINKGNVIIQTGLANESSLPWVDGLSFEGKITKIDFFPAKNGKSTRIRLNFSSALGYYRLDCRVNSFGMATITLESLGTSAQMVFRGEIDNPVDTEVFNSGSII